MHRLLIVIGLALTVMAALTSQLFHELASGHFVGLDFVTYWCAWKAIGQGGSPYDAATLHAIADAYVHSAVYPYLYPPTLAVLGSPLGELSPTAVWRGWAVASIIAAGVTTAAAALASGDGSVGSALWKRAMLAGVLVLALQAQSGLYEGQVNLLVLCVLTMGLALRSKAPAWSGALLAIAALVKATPALLFLLLALPSASRRRFVMGGVVSAFAVIVLTVTVAGLQPWRDFLSSLPSSGPGATPPGLFAPANVLNFSIAGFSARLGFQISTIRILWIIVLLGLVAPLGFSFYWFRQRALQVEWLVLPALVIMVVSAPYTYVHHVIFLLPGAVWTLGRARWDLRALALLIALLVSAFNFPVMYHRLGWLGLWSSLNLYALLAVWALSLTLAWSAFRVSSR